MRIRPYPLSSRRQKDIRRPLSVLALTRVESGSFPGTVSTTGVTSSRRHSLYIRPAASDAFMRRGHTGERRIWECIRGGVHVLIKNDAAVDHLFIFETPLLMS